MDVYILDDKLRRERCVDTFNSFIWAERYSEKGDFQIVLNAFDPAVSFFELGTPITILESFRYASVDTIERDVDSNGADIVKISGYTGEVIFEHRVAKKNTQNLELNPNWEISGIPRDIIKQMVYTVCKNYALSFGDGIPYLLEGDFLIAPGTWLALPENLYWNAAIGEWATAYTSNAPGTDPIDPIVVNSKPQSLYKTIKEICDAYGLGFRLVKNYDKSEVYFEVYTGQDRSSLQTFYDPIRFSPEMNNLVSNSEISTIKDSYNVAYVFSKKSFQEVRSPYEVKPVSGRNRRVIYHEVTQYEEDQTLVEHNRLLRQEGLELLAQHNPLTAFDGEITKSSQYKYGVDYELGDLVEVRRSDGMMSRMRVTEQIFVHDEAGERSYPTLASFDVVDPKTWAGQNTSLYWSQAEGYWIDWV